MSSAAGRGRLVVATANEGKLAELARILAACGYKCLPQSAFGIEPAPETGATFEENALQKAEQAARAAGLPAVADDSGLEVDALGGKPGVRSARYAGEGAGDRANIEKLLSELAGVPQGRRGARFRCVAAFVEPGGGAPLVARGEWRGRILATPRGTGGFGYDPVFYDPLRGRTAAELSAAEKDEASHRGRAFRELAGLLASRERLA